jgi:predicted transposase YbfD/YdcC
VDGIDNWSKLTTGIHVERIRDIKGKIQKEESWYMSSRFPDAEAAARAVRLHWGVENKLHWRLGVIFGDDKCQLHSGFGPLNMSVIKRFCMNMLEKDKEKRPAKRKIMRAAITDEYRERLMFG